VIQDLGTRPWRGVSRSCAPVVMSRRVQGRSAGGCGARGGARAARPEAMAGALLMEQCKADSARQPWHGTRGSSARRPCSTACAPQAAGSSALTAMAGRVDEVELKLMAAAVTRG
jgi:hypothetical protein